MISALALFLVGLLFIYNGLQMRKRRLQLGSSWGFRTAETQTSAAVWKASHAAGGMTVMLGGLGAEIAGAILLLSPAHSMTVNITVTLCGLGWVVLLYLAAKGRVTETAARLNRKA